jgi:hypothetical protein
MISASLMRLTFLIVSEEGCRIGYPVFIQPLRRTTPWQRILAIQAFYQHGMRDHLNRFGFIGCEYFMCSC